MTRLPGLGIKPGSAKSATSQVIGLPNIPLGTIYALLIMYLECFKSSYYSLDNTNAFFKVESPETLANLSGIPANETTKVKVSEQLAKYLKSSSENIAMEVHTIQI